MIFKTIIKYYHLGSMLPHQDLLVELIVEKMKKRNLLSKSPHHLVEE